AVQRGRRRLRLGRERSADARSQRRFQGRVEPSFPDPAARDRVPPPSPGRRLHHARNAAGEVLRARIAAAAPRGKARRLGVEMGRSLDVALLFCVLCIAASQLHSTPAAPTPDSTISPRPSVAQFPPPPTDPERASLRRASLAPPVRGNADAAMERLAKWATLDADPLRRTFANSGDLYGFVESHLARATAGDGAASYYIYLALDECRPYLRMNAEEARALAQRMQPDLSSAAVEE